jgi:hypothetical protein
MSEQQTTSPDARLEKVTAWTAYFMRTGGAVLGSIFVAMDMTLMSGHPLQLRLLVAAGGFSMMGPVVATNIAQIIRAVRGGADE